MALDDKAFHELMSESQDLHVDAIKQIRQTLPALAEVREERRGQPVDTDQVERFNVERRRVLASLGYGTATVGLLSGGFGAMFAGLLSTPAYADTPLDVQVLQTASSLERLAINTYGAALKLPFISGGNAVVKKFAQTTMMQHNEHRMAFQAQTKTLGGTVQDSPNPKFLKVVNAATPGLKAPADVVKLASSLEKVATDTYLVNLTLLTDVTSKEIMGSVMGVECQHLATLRAVGALLAGGAAKLIKIPLGADLGMLPAAAGSVAFPDALEKPNPALLAAPSTGARK